MYSDESLKVENLPVWFFFFKPTFLAFFLQVERDVMTVQKGQRDIKLLAFKTEEGAPEPRNAGSL